MKIAIKYTILTGDTIDKIKTNLAKCKGMTVQAIQSANPTVDPTKLAIGQLLNIPDMSSPDMSKPLLALQYTIQSGDYFSLIADNIDSCAGVSSDDILAANPGLSPTTLQIGEVIVIPIAVQPVLAQISFKTDLPNVTPPSPVSYDLTQTTYGELKTFISNWTQQAPDKLIIGTADLGLISESPSLADDTLLIDCKVFDSAANTWKYYFTAEGTQVGVLSTEPPKPNTYRPTHYKVCLYYSSWSIYGRNYYPPAVDYSRITHLIYAFADIAPDSKHPEPSGKVLADGTVYMPDINDIRANFKSLQDIKGQWPHLKTILSIGGWTYSINFSDVAADPAKRQCFVDSAADLMNTHGFDGIDIDWEIPVEGGNNITHRPEDKQNFTTLLQELRDKIGTDKLLTIAGPARPKFHQNIEVEKIATIVDWVNLMAYDYHGPWGGTADAVTNYNAPLYADYTAPIPGGITHDLNVDASVRSLLTLNLPPQKLVLGLSFYGRGYAGVNPGPNHDGLYQSYHSHPHGTWPDETGQASGVYDYWDLHDNYIGKPGWNNYYNHQAGAAWLYNESEGVFIAYDNPQTIWNKCAYLASLQLGGAMMWEASNDRYNQLLGVVNNALYKGGIKATGGLIPASSGDTPTWTDSSLSVDGANKLTKIVIAKTDAGIIGLQTTYGTTASAWRGSHEGIRTEVIIPADRFIDRIDFYQGNGTDQEAFIGIGLNIDNRTYIGLGDTSNISNMVSIGAESSRLTHFHGTVQNGKLTQLTGDFDQSFKQGIAAFQVFEDLTDVQFEKTPLQYQIANGYAYLGHIEGSVSIGGVAVAMAAAGIDTPHMSVTVGSFDFANQVSFDGGFTYKVGMQFQPIAGSVKIGDPNNPAIAIDYEGPEFGFYEEASYKNGNLEVKCNETAFGFDIAGGTGGFKCDAQVAGVFSETLEISSSEVKIGINGDGIEINKYGIGFFFTIGPFTVHINVISVLVLAYDIMKDIYEVGKAIWEASFKIYLAFKEFITGVVDAIEDLIDALF
ncbi:MAG: LysM peptidoglycan-binding domain-containing protein [Saprospiraceae bacterium]|nr:LysM peptidoglycan-binding domain-containing protein [Saprospiraceae bacterium]